METKTVVAPKVEKGLEDGLGRFLADTYALYLRTQNHHWNVTGRRFAELHAFFEREYTELALAVDLVAERLRALGCRAPGSFAEFTRLTSLVDDEGKWLPAEEMVRVLLRDHEALAGSARRLLEEAEEVKDAVTADLATARLAAHEKEAWMLRSLLE